MGVVTPRSARGAFPVSRNAVLVAEERERRRRRRRPPVWYGMVEPNQSIDSELRESGGRARENPRKENTNGSVSSAVVNPPLVRDKPTTRPPPRPAQHARCGRTTTALRLRNVAARSLSFSSFCKPALFRPGHVWPARQNRPRRYKGCPTASPQLGTGSNRGSSRSARRREQPSPDRRRSFKECRLQRFGRSTRRRHPRPRPPDAKYS